MLHRRPKLKTVAIVTVCSVVILAGIAVGAVRLVDEVFPGYRTEVADWVSEKLDQPVTIGGMALVWRWRGPSLRFSDVALLDKQGNATGLQLDALALRFTFSDLIHGRTMPNSVALVGLHLALVQTPDGSLHLRNLAGASTRDLSMQRVAQRLQKIERIKILHSQLRLALNAFHAPVKLTNVTGSLSNHGAQHDLVAHARIASRHGKRISLHATAVGNLAKPSATSGHIDIHANGLASIRLIRLAGITYNGLHGGRTDVELWADWNTHGLVGARAKIHVSPFTAESPDGTNHKITPPLTLRLNAKPLPSGTRIRLNTLTSRAFKSSNVAGTLILQRDSGRIHGKLSNVPARLIAAGLHLWRPDSMAAVRLRGQLRQVQFALHPDNDWRIRTTFRGLRISNPHRGLHAGPFDGSLSINDHGGTLRLDTNNAGLESARYVNGRLPLHTLSGKITWQQTANGHKIGLSDVQLISAKTTITATGTLRLPAQGPPVADLQFGVHSPNIAPFLDYVPQTKDMPFQRLRDWLPEAILSGRVESGRVRVKGPMDQFPFPDGGGTFHVELKGEDFVLAFKPEWPHLTDISGTVTLSGTTLHIEGQSARMLGVELDHAQGHIEDISNPILKVTGNVAQANIAAMMAVLTHSPLQEKFGRIPKILNVDGPTSLHLQLSIPLKPGAARGIGVKGRIQASGVSLDTEVLPRPIQDIRGVVHFDREGVYADGLKARFLGLPITATIQPNTTASANKQSLTIRATAQMQLPSNSHGLDAILPGPLLERAKGQTTWHFRLNVSPVGHTSDLKLYSNLKGLALNLPAPLGKSADTTVPLTATLSNDHKRLRIDYGDRLSLRAHLSGKKLKALNIVFGGAEVTPPPGPGIWVGGKLPVVPIHEWRRLANGFGTGGGSSWHFRGADIHVAGLRLGKRRIGPMSIKVLPLIGADGWLAQIDGKGATGHLRLLARGTRARISASFEHVSLQVVQTTDHAREDNDNQSSTTGSNDVIDPASLPTMALFIANLQVNGTRLGRLHIDADAIQHGLILNDLHLTSSGLTVSVTGRWQRKSGKSSASFKGKLTGGDIGRVLAIMGFGGVIKAQSTHIQGKLHFAGRASGLKLAALNGHVHLEMHNGVLTTVNSGATRILSVLGLFNFHALPRRFQLDFGDVIGQGFAFDTISGDFRIKNGVAYTDNLKIETPAATIQVEGRIDFASKSYDEHVTLEPKISSAATIAGTVLGGPVVGLVVYLVQDLLDQPLSDIASVSYHLTGSWSNPTIKSVEAKK